MSATEEERYRITRFYADLPDLCENVARGLTLAQAKAWCNDDETSSTTAKGEFAQLRTSAFGPWFDGYEIEGMNEDE